MKNLQLEHLKKQIRVLLNDAEDAALSPTADCRFVLESLIREIRRLVS